MAGAHYDAILFVIYWSCGATSLWLGARAGRQQLILRMLDCMDIAWLVFGRLENGCFLVGLGSVRDRTIYNLVIPPNNIFWP
jgi:hypothetical protein